jgi:hypothetical protein
MKEIENSKRKCSKCNEKLLKLAEIQQEIEDIQLDSEIDINKQLNFKFYNNETEIASSSKNPISITQKSTTEENVKVPDIFVPDPLPLNPNSIENVRKVLEHIKEISGINKKERKWIAVICDGVLYNYAQKIKKDFPEILLIPGLLHEKMNMLKAFVELNWYDYKNYFKIILYYINIFFKKILGILI